MLFLWDIDGTLVATGGAGMRALDRACTELFGIAGLEGKISAHGKTDPMLIDEIFRRFRGRDAEPHEHDRVLQRYLQHLEAEVARSERYRIYPGVLESLAVQETRGAAIGLATGNVARGAEIKLLRGDLWRRFPFGGFGSDAADRGALVARAIARAEAHAGRRFDRREVFVIGDTTRDVAAAHACGAVALAVATGPDRPDALRAAGADVVFETLEGLPDWLAAHPA
jgi:phosphoglycolate phosphatase